jgi:hypothetical protein
MGPGHIQARVYSIVLVVYDNQHNFSMLHKTDAWSTASITEPTSTTACEVYDTHYAPTSISQATLVIYQSPAVHGIIERPSGWHHG